MIKGVITGDLIRSTSIAAEWRPTVMEALNACIADCTAFAPTKIEMYRGDSFQIVTDSPQCTLTTAVALRAKLRASTPEQTEIWDARLSIGIGDISFESNDIVTSDGEAFRLSGRAFDSIGKKRLNISTPWADVDEAINLTTCFADEIISAWTTKQAKVVYHALFSLKTQKDMADELGMSRQNFNYHWTSSKGQLIVNYIEFYKTLIDKYIK